MVLRWILTTPAPSPGGDHGDELLARAVIEALQAGTSWAQIAAQLGVPPSSAGGRADMTEHDWQEAIITHENARAARLSDRTSPRRPETS
ncbi:hypothetical protein P3H15_49930 [Rhodococcus sp. T2V]|uniref:hypothetical protein n=1 Tax=Rhodococcus sp. T2V TaxID=3034164 RepID=UPI0023E120E9|nr:hypothetical protein [Rhodococcus sp. T2V]MDF3313044.1 hypothetical protein [Rhodococcus sp. T2V]